MLGKLNDALGKGLQTIVGDEDNADIDRNEDPETNDEEEEENEEYEAVKKLIQENITLKKQLEVLATSVCTFMYSLQ